MLLKRFLGLTIVIFAVFHGWLTIATGMAGGWVDRYGTFTPSDPAFWAISALNVILSAFMLVLGGRLMLGKPKQAGDV